jgi:hypothetical protein
MIKDNKTVRQPMKAMIVFDSDFLNNPFIRKPSSGKRGIKYARFIMYISKAFNFL